MCLVTKQSEAKIADRDFIVYKVARKDRDGHYAPFRDHFKYDLNVVLESELVTNEHPGEYDIFWGEVLPSNKRKVEEGLHSISTIREAMRIRGFCISDSLVKYGHFDIIECIVPEGARYYKGDFNGMVGYTSDKLVMKKVLTRWEVFKLNMRALWKKIW